jgi:hypothetical protein
MLPVMDMRGGEIYTLQNTLTAAVFMMETQSQGWIKEVRRS